LIANSLFISFFNSSSLLIMLDDEFDDDMVLFDGKLFNDVELDDLFIPCGFDCVARASTERPGTLSGESDMGAKRLGGPSLPADKSGLYGLSGLSGF
jgi:hypothetical protein